MQKSALTHVLVWSVCTVSALTACSEDGDSIAEQPGPITPSGISIMNGTPVRPAISGPAAPPQGEPVAPGEVSDGDPPAATPPARPSLQDELSHGMPTLAPSALSAVWAGEGGRKVVREERPGTADPTSVHSAVWDGLRLSTFGARNEIVNAAFVLEAPDHPVEDVAVRVTDLVGPGGYALRAPDVSGDEVFDHTKREVELFYVRYLQIRGLSRLTWDLYDERHIPEAFRRPYSLPLGLSEGSWEDRPHHDTHYPDIAVPMEVVPTFDIAARESQMIWMDVYVPRDAPAGEYQGSFGVWEGGELTRVIPVTLRVRDFALPDTQNAKTMMFLGYSDPNERYLGQQYPDYGKGGEQAALIRDRHFQMAHRHRIALIDTNDGPSVWAEQAPRPEWWPRLDGSLYTAEHGYAGPGEGVGSNVFSIGTYGTWGWKWEGKEAMWERTDAWATWFAEHSPDTELFLYLIDESDDWWQIEQWASWMNENPGPGAAIMSMATTGFAEALTQAPSLDIPCTTFKVAPATWEETAKIYREDPERRLWLYNGGRPNTGSLAIEDEGVAMRQMAWAQWKKGVERWFIWESTYYDNYQGGTGDTNVFESAHTFGGLDGYDAALGMTGWNYTNGDGVFFYPGTDVLYPEDSYGLNGPIASLRLKYYRRGLQDYEYLKMAAEVDPGAVEEIVEDLIPAVLWEIDVDNYGDPTYTHTDISWSTDPDAWEAARAALAEIIEEE